MATEPKKMGRLEKGKKTAWIGALITILVMIAIFVWWKVPKPTFAGSRSAGIEAGQPRFGDFSYGINSIHITKKWSGGIYNDSRFIMYGGQPMEKNTAWQVMYDDDPNKVYTFPPANAPGTGDFNYTNTWTSKKVRIEPSQQTAKSEYVFHLDPR